VLVPRLGYVGAGYATFGSYLLYTVCVGVRGRRIYAWRLDARRTVAWTGFLVVSLVALQEVRDLMSGLPYAANLTISLVLAGAIAAWCMAGLLRRTSVSGVWREVRRGRAQ
jgi:hypothetical protein